MSATTLAAPIRVDIAGAHARPRIGRLVTVELRKMVDTRAGFWLQVATVATTLVAVIARSVTGEAADHTFASVLSVGLLPAAVLLPVVGILLVTSEWSQRTGMITFSAGPGTLAHPRRQAHRQHRPSHSRCSSCPSPSSPPVSPPSTAPGPTPER
jgi:ABC-2 type transport system permease protein